MNLCVNGERMEIDFDEMLPTLLTLFHLLKLSLEGRFVELNGDIYNSDLFSTVVLKEGDVVEIIQFMGGGDLPIHI